MLPRYTLASGTQVREEDFGLLFYTLAGPRLYLMNSGVLLETGFFEGRMSLREWIERHDGAEPVPETRIGALQASLNQLSRKGVIREC